MSEKIYGTFYSERLSALPRHDTQVLLPEMVFLKFEVSQSPLGWDMQARRRRFRVRGLGQHEKSD